MVTVDNVVTGTVTDITVSSPNHTEDTVTTDQVSWWVDGRSVRGRFEGWRLSA